ncbi:MAG: ubiquinone biosynthesis regulatory protein kinase UbiB, partial [Gammaproteobacteria bacterium]|nr:ubiquinone biosynthesis regulatory protein kinase UbiB [Gammaproteobacteria bacterium]
MTDTIRCFVLINVTAWFNSNHNTRGQRIRVALEILGPIFVKFGQVLSTRPDLLPDDIVTELAKLQDQVPAFPNEQARAIIEKSYQQSIAVMFKQFSTEPLASASVAQVYAATLPDDKDVIVKIIRPGIEKNIRRDIKLLYLLAKLMKLLWRDAKRLHPIAIVKEFSTIIHDELDMQREAANASKLK